MLAAAIACAGAGPAVRGAAPARRKRLNRIQLAGVLRKEVKSPALVRATVGVAVTDLVDGRSLFTHEPDRLHIVASNAKLATTAAALELLGPRFEFRTTVVPGWLVEGDIEEIAHWIAGAERYVLQQFRPFHTLDPALEKLSPYPLDRLQEMASRAGRWVGQATVRGG